jgi:hypothetical protein
MTLGWIGKVLCLVVVLTALTALTTEVQAHTLAVWDRITGDVGTAGPSGDVDHYDVYLCLGSACATNTFQKVATVPQVPPPVAPATKAEVSWALPVNTAGRVKVRAVDKSGNESPDSNVAEFDRNPPPAPAVGAR